MQLSVEIKNRVATYKAGDDLPICGNTGDTIVFSFDEEWTEHDKKTARFIWGNKYTDVEFTGDTCEIPVISGAQVLLVGVYAGELAEDDFMLSTTLTSITYELSARCGNRSAQPTSGRNYTNEARGYAADAADAAEKAEKALGKTEKNTERAEEAARIAESMAEGFSTPEMFGAAGDGVTDDTEALRAAFNKSNTVICNGNYYVTGAINLRSNTTAIFNGTVTHPSVPLEAEHGYFFMMDGVSNITIEGGTFVSTRDQVGIAPGEHVRENYMNSHVSLLVAFNNADRITVRNVKTVNLECLTVRHATNITFDGCDFKGAIMGMYCDYIDNFKVLNTKIDLATELGNGDHCVYFCEYCHNVLLENCTFTGDEYAGHLVDFTIRNADNEEEVGSNNVVKNCKIVGGKWAFCAVSHNFRVYDCYIESECLFYTHGAGQREMSFYNCTIKITNVRSSFDSGVPTKVLFSGCDLHDVKLVTSDLATGCDVEYDNCRLKHTNNGLLYVQPEAVSGTLIMRNCSVDSSRGEIVTIKGAIDRIDIENCNIKCTDNFVWVEGDGKTMTVKFTTISCDGVKIGANKDDVKFLSCYDKTGTLIQ